MSMGGHRNWQLSRCGENRDAQKRLATKNTVTSWTTDKHFFLWRRDGQPTFTFQHFSSNFNSSVGVARTANHHTNSKSSGTQQASCAATFKLERDEIVSFLAHEVTRCKDAKMKQCPTSCQGGKVPNFFFSCRTRKILSVPVKLQRRLKRIFLSSSVHLGSPQKRLESWGVKLGILSGFW